MASFRKFLVTFIAFILLFGIIGYFATNFISGIVDDIMDKNEGKNNPGAEDGSGNGETPPDAYASIEGKSYSFLILITDFDPENKSYAPDDSTVKEITTGIKNAKSSVGMLKKYSGRVRATSAVLVKVDKEAGEYFICYISPETRLYTPAGALAIGDVYGLYGINTVKQYVKGMTGIDVDYHFVLDGYTLEDVIKTLGMTTVNIETGICSFGEYYMTDSNFSKEEFEKKDDGDETDEKGKDGKEKDTLPIEKMPTPEYVVYVGSRDLSGETLTAVANLRECSIDDVKLKCRYVTSTVEYYLRKFADTPKDEIKGKIKKLTASTPYASDDPLEYKPSMATDFKPDDVDKIYELIKAIKLFKVNVVCYPGNYVSTGGAEIGYYAPSYKTAIEDYRKYR